MQFFTCELPAFQLSCSLNDWLHGQADSIYSVSSRQSQCGAEVDGILSTQSQELCLVSGFWVLADSTAREKESLFDVGEDGACEPWGFETQDTIPPDDSTAGFALTRRVLHFLFS
ncbi:pro-neuropeptide y [Limosa lapponica baueri]|uniref:Pro-neuropeptide y n=1 Tax=Limosa lapponica baueri TaxID=1758121 RepID=A0A2I0TCY1_LIMLA|nr:pro-neuropeptide y [Limosa lapponica baueri]